MEELFIYDTRFTIYEPVVKSLGRVPVNVPAHGTVPAQRRLGNLRYSKLGGATAAWRKNLRVFAPVGKFFVRQGAGFWAQILFAAMGW